MKRLLSALIIIASAIGSTVLKSKGHTKSAILTLILGAGAAGGVLYLTSWAAELTEIPTNFTAGDFGFLNSSITTTATTITVSPITKWVNGTKTTGCFDSGSGFVLMQDGAGRTEYASYGAKSCASNVTSLTDVRRGLNPTGSSFDAGTGLSFAASTSIRVVNWPGLFNNAVYKIQRNTMTGSGKTICNTTRQTCFNVGTASAAVRNAMNVETGDMIYNTTSGTAEFYNGTNWIQFGSGSVINATETQDGKVSIAGTGAMLTGSGQGINGAIDVISANYTTASGGLSVGNQIGYAMVTDKSGFASGALLGQGGGGGSGLLVLTAAQTYVNANTLVAAGSGGNIMGGSGAKIIGTTNVTTTSFADLDADKLAETFVTEAGDILMFVFNGVVGESNQNYMSLDIVRDGTSIVSSGGIINSAALRVPSGNIIDTNMSFTHLYTEATAGSHTYKMQGKTSGAGTAKFRNPVHFQVLKMNK